MCVVQTGVTPRPIIHVFERDASPTSRPGQGYAINIRDNGPKVLKLIGLWDKVLECAAPGQRMLLCDSKFNEWIHLEQGEHKKKWTCRVQRAKLRALLLQQLPHQITWNKIAIGVDQPTSASTSSSSGGGSSSKATIRFSDGSIEDGVDLVISADGARSKIRTAVAPDQTLHYMGTEMLTGEAQFPNGLPPHVAAGTLMSMGNNGTSLFMAPMTSHSAVWTLGYNNDTYHDEVRTGSMLAGDAATTNMEMMQSQLRRELHQRSNDEYTTNEWKSMLAATSQIGRMPCMDKLPHTHRGLVTFIGDACHAFTPYSGNGANMAMMDAWQFRCINISITCHHIIIINSI
jgi:2-polyprenyl-6-methoxyphenol hydroxylase-like FAD-dependent oxidoreductase